MKKIKQIPKSKPVKSKKNYAASQKIGRLDHSKVPNPLEILFVNHPPEEITYTEGQIHRLPNLYIRGIDLLKKSISTEQLLKFLSARETAREEPTPLHLLEYFVEIHKIGVYPPIAILNWIYSGFQKYLENGGDLELALGLGVGKGGTPPLRRKAEHRRDRFCCEQMFLFTKTFDLTIEDAAPIIASLLTGAPNEFGFTHVRLKPIIDVTIDDRYRKDRRWRQMRSSMEIAWSDLFGQTSSEEKTRILGRVSYDILPFALQRQHPDHKAI